VILTFNRVEELLRTVGHTVMLPERPHVIVVDNGSSDGSAQRVRLAFPQVQVVSLDSNIGAAARNVGARMAAGEYVAFCDDDTCWGPGALAAGVRLLRADTRIAVVSARILVGAERREDPVSRAMAAMPLHNPDGPRGAVIGFMAGACLFRRRAFLEAGGYEPRLFIGGEEGLLALDLAARGWSLVYSDALTVYHLPSALRDNAARSRLLVRNALLVSWLRRRAVHAWRETFSALVRAVRDPVARAGCIDAFRQLHWVLRERRPVPPKVEAAWRQIERQLGGEVGGAALHARVSD